MSAFEVRRGVLGPVLWILTGTLKVAGQGTCGGGQQPEQEKSDAITTQAADLRIAATQT